MNRGRPVPDVVRRLRRTTRDIHSLAVLIVSILATDAGLSGAGGMPTMQLEPLLEWNGPFFRVARDPSLEQRTDDPVTETPFTLPRAVASRMHNGRKVVYVLDSGNHRVQAFEVNATRRSLSREDFDWIDAGSDPAPGGFTADRIRLPEWSRSTEQWILPGSVLLHIDAVAWSRVEVLGGRTAADRVYALHYGAAADHPQIELPPGSLSGHSSFEIRYAVSDYQDGGGSPARYGLGDVDYGIRYGSGEARRTVITEQSGGPSSWHQMRSMSLLPDPSDRSGDILFLLDSADDGTAGSAQLFSFLVEPDGQVRPGERYEDRLERPFAVCAAEMDTGRGASARVEGTAGPFNQATRPLITDANQVTGRDYIVTVHADTSVTIQEAASGRVLVRAAPQWTLADPFLGIPGVSLALSPDTWSPGTTQVRTVRPYPGRYLFVADEGADRIKVIGLGGGNSIRGSCWEGDWLPGDVRRTASQPSDSGSVGGDPAVEYRPVTPAAVGRNWRTFTAAFPLSETSLQTATFDPDRSADRWTRVDDISTAGPADRVFQVDWRTGAIQFGDGIHGAIPPAGAEIDYGYATTPDVARFGTSGTGDERFTSPRGIAARWNPDLRRFDVYVADTGNGRIQKLAFSPEDTTRHLPPMIRHVVTWSGTGSGGPDLMHPVAVGVAEDGDGRVYLAVSDPGSSQVHLYRDADPGSPCGARQPVLETSLGGRGNQPGRLMDPAGVAFVRSGQDLDLYVTDSTRRTVTKYEQTPVPEIELLFTDGSALPADFPSGSGYTIRFRTQHAPLDGWVDFYFDTAPDFDQRSARLCLPPGSTAPAAGQAFWRFRDSPGGAPPDGSYHLYARLKDASGATVAVDQSASSRLLTLDSRLVATLRATDALDGDRTLYLQNNLVRSIALELLYPDSIAGVGIMGAFDTALVEIEAITPGTLWNGVSFTDELFSGVFDNGTGTFEVFSSVIGAPVGLLEGGPHTVASIRVRCRPDAISPGMRTRRGTFSIDRTRSSMADVRGRNPSDWSVRSLSLRAGYLGDIATTSAGADSVVPALQPNPDGRIDFDDQMVFTLAWNGAGNVRDPIADMGPGTGASPDILPVPDRLWDIDDLLVFTSQASYFYQAGWNRGGTRDPEGADTAPGALVATQDPIGPVGHRLCSATPCPLSVVQTIEADGTLRIRVDCDPLPGLMGAFLRLEYDTDRYAAERPRPAGMLGREDVILAVTALEPDAAVLSLSRLCPESPGVDRGGSIGLFTLSLQAGAGGRTDGPLWKLTYDLRNTANNRLAAGGIVGGEEQRLTSDAGSPRLFLAPASPNPAIAGSTIRFGTPGRRPVEIHLFDAAGRKVRTLWDGDLDAGTHAIEWDVSDDLGRRLPGGVYFLRMAAGGEQSEQRVAKISVLH